MRPGWNLQKQCHIIKAAGCLLQCKKKNLDVGFFWAWCSVWYVSLVSYEQGRTGLCLPTCHQLGRGHGNAK